MRTQLPELSALLDGALEPHEARPLVRSVVQDSELRKSWQAYVLVGDQLRQEGSIATDLTAGVMARIREEPVVLAPGLPPRQAERKHSLLALAASLAGVAIVGWLALSDPHPMPANGQMVAVAPVPTFMSVPTQVSGSHLVVASTVPLRSNMSGYPLARHIHASTFRLNDSTEPLRTVTMSGNSNRP